MVFGMKRTEVKLWIDYHQSIFPEWHYSRSDSPQAKKLAFNAICKALVKIEAEDAQEASDRMLAGTIRKPFRDEEHLAAIVTGAKAISSQRYAQNHPRVDGQKTVACPFCLDTGYVDCWRRNLVDQMTVLCSCAAGDKIAETDFGKHAQRYDPKLCYRVGDESPYWLGIRADRQADIAAGIERLPDGSPVTPQQYAEYLADAH